MEKGKGKGKEKGKEKGKRKGKGMGRWKEDRLRKVGLTHGRTDARTDTQTILYSVQCYAYSIEQTKIWEGVEGTTSSPNPPFRHLLFQTFGSDTALNDLEPTKLATLVFFRDFPPGRRLQE